MPPLALPPHFHAVAAFGFKANRVYRVYVLRDRLLFAYVGPDKQQDAAMVGVAVAGGVLGVLIVSLIKKAAGPSPTRLDRLDELDETPLDELGDEHKFNFEATPDEFTVARLAPRSFWHGLNYSDWKHKAILRLRHPTYGKFNLAIHDEAEARGALVELRRLFGDQLAVDAEWSSGQGRYVAIGRGDGE